MHKQKLLTQTKLFFTKIPLKWWIIGGVSFVLLLSYVLIFLIPKNVQFSYAEKTCVNQLVIAPDTQKVSSDEFTATFENYIRVGNAALFATKVCLEPTKTLAEDSYIVRIAPGGSWFASKQLAVEVPKAPVAKASDLIGRSISATQPLKIKLTSADVIHTYHLKIAEKDTQCEQTSAELTCDIKPLELKHGTTYTASVYQAYKAASKKVIEGQLETLQPLVVTAASVSNDQTIYDKPTEFSFTFDRPVEKGEVSLVKVVGDATEVVEVSQHKDAATLKVAFGELAREATYRLTLSDAVADNGSSLAEPVVITFKTSGGPKVASVSVGSHSVSRSARIIVTFDQPIDASVDIAKLARIEGLAGSVKKHSDTQLAFTIQGGDCSAFALVVDKGIKSGSNGEVSKDGWKFNSRTICGSSWVIGSSVQGRSIVAYSFGSGSKTILFTAAIHGSEPSSYSTMMAWVKHLQAYGDIVPADKRVVVVPNTNPDGIAVGSRNNSRNVNLGRNFPTHNWQASIETASGTLPTGGGNSPGSEPETAALMALTRQLRPRLEISFHAQGSLVGANKFGDSVAIGDIYAKTVGYRTMFYNAEAVMGYPMTGEYEDWMGEQMGIPAILIELPRSSGNYLSGQLNALKKMLAI